MAAPAGWHARLNSAAGIMCAPRHWFARRLRRRPEPAMRRKTCPTTFYDDELVFDGPSKTQIKSEMIELQELGATVMELPDAHIDRIVMSEDLREALHELRRLTKPDARQRQTRYIGKLLRDADAKAFRAAIAAWRIGKQKEALLLPEIERWRERLLADVAALAEFSLAYPDCNNAPFRALLRNARREQAEAPVHNPALGLPPPASKGRFYRELFQKIRVAVQAGGTAGL